MFTIQYKAKPLEDVVFSTFGFHKVAAKNTSTVQMRVTGPEGTRFLIRGLQTNFPPKPCNLPFNKKFEREGNVISGGYLAWEPLQLSMHVKDPAGPSAAALDASSEWVSRLVSSIWEQRAICLDKIPAGSRPRSQAVLRDCAKSAAIFTDLVIPRATPVGGCSTFGVEAQIVGHGTAVSKVHLARTSSSKMPERVAWADYLSVPVPEGPEDPSDAITTELYLVVKNASGEDACVTQVPLTEDGGLFSDSPRCMSLLGEPLWRKVGPQDILPGSMADAECMLLPASIFTDSLGGVGVSKRLVYFRVPEHATSIKKGATERPEMLSRDETEKVFAGMKRARESTD